MNASRFPEYRDIIKIRCRTAIGLLELPPTVALAHTVVNDLQVALATALAIENELRGVPNPTPSRD